MSTVLFTYAYPPFRFPRAIQIGRLVKYSKLELRVLCCDDGSPRDAGIPGASPGQPVEVRVLPDKAGRWRKLARRLWLPDAQRPWALRIARQAADAGWVGRDDVLVSFGQPMSDHLAGLYLKRRLGMPWMAHFSDPWSDNPYHLPLPGMRRMHRAMEYRVAEHADRLLFTSRETLDLVMAKYPTGWRGKAAVLPHAFDPELYGPDAPPRTDGRRVVRYVGNFYRQRNPLALAHALLRVQREQPALIEGVRLELVGRWVGRPDWRAESLGLRDGLLTLRAPVPYLESLRLMREADLLMILDAPFEHSVFFPSKLVDYIGAQRPILAFTPPGACADIVNRLGCMVSPAGEAEVLYPGLVDALQRLARGALAAPDATLAQDYAAVRVAARFDAMADELRGGQRP